MVRKHLIQAALAVAGLMLSLALIGWVFEAQLERITLWLFHQIGFAGMCLTLLITDTLVTPFPPDLLLLVVANSPLAERGLLFALILGLVSSCAGVLGWAIGRWLQHFEAVQRTIACLPQDKRQFIIRYGFWAIALGAVTPFPFSLTCWSAGALGLRAATVALAGLVFRVPRFVLYYWLIAAAT